MTRYRPALYFSWMGDLVVEEHRSGSSSFGCSRHGIGSNTIGYDQQWRGPLFFAPILEQETHNES
jgi:hypothetical protein